tara:strand:- start:8424 stop:8891 length:468 start_codon:yes stop_codon:yes gene_type:complete
MVSEEITKRDTRKYLYMLIIGIILVEVILILFAKLGSTDTFLILLCIFAQINLIYSMEMDKIEQISQSHFAFGAFLIIIPLLSENIWFLSIVITIIMLTLVFRKKKGECPLTTFDKNVVDYSFGGRINWDWMYMLFGMIALVKIIYVYSKVVKKT